MTEAAVDDGSASFSDVQPFFYNCTLSEWDTFPDSGPINCGICTALVPTEYLTCRHYCAAQEHGLTCVHAWEDKDDGCEEDGEGDRGCDFDFSTLNTTDMICECDSLEVEIDYCSTHTWDVDDKGGSSIAKYCGNCKVLTNAVEIYYTCDYFCAFQSYGGFDGHACVGAWEDMEDNCGTLSEHACDFDFRELRTSDMICQCSETLEAPWSQLFASETPPKKSKAPLIAGLAIGILFLLAGMGVGLMWIIEASRKREQGASQAPTFRDRVTLRMRGWRKELDMSKSKKTAELAEPLTPEKNAPTKSRTPSKEESNTNNNNTLAVPADKPGNNKSDSKRRATPTSAKATPKSRKKTPKSAKASTGKKKTLRGQASPYTEVPTGEGEGDYDESDYEDEAPVPQNL
eukprot:gb/GEZN01006499.1/.p1 GENE.gb/GEZN01006499.1/~~gb/GEZN01006499.1/.p1  ORF type:complete len:430 (-),score=62.01 gb/GEZN01006499.1/:365-1570(-)